jgi:hypothetical protein
MRLPVLLAVGVVPPPPPYLPPPYTLLLVGVVPPDPELLVLLPQAKSSMTSVATMRTVHNARLEPFEMKRLRCIMVSSLASGDTASGNEYLYELRYINKYVLKLLRSSFAHSSLWKYAR